MGETSQGGFKPGHSWHYFSEQQRHEALLIRVHDRAKDGRARLLFHISFENPLTSAGALRPDPADGEVLDLQILLDAVFRPFAAQSR
jgi:hypothetical protein